ncbi:conserved phage C-terminal domain-containing protein [Sporosarcina sp. E16_8]|nr:conserved phage C-terminal domain-containing protein [Sporosarcina sp. E16_8]
MDDPHWQKYLLPSTLYNATNFENYLEESRVSDLPDSSSPKPLELDFSEGEA